MTDFIVVLVVDVALVLCAETLCPNQKYLLGLRGYLQFGGVSRFPKILV
jgi:hypothetical protein